MDAIATYRGRERVTKIVPSAHRPSRVGPTTAESPSFLPNRIPPSMSNGHMEMSDLAALAAVRAGDRDAFRVLVRGSVG